MLTISNTLTFRVPEGNMCAGGFGQKNCSALRSETYDLSAYHSCNLFLKELEFYRLKGIFKCKECLDACAKELEIIDNG